MSGICVAVVYHLIVWLSRNTVLKLWKSRPAAHDMTFLPAIVLILLSTHRVSLSMMPWKKTLNLRCGGQTPMVYTFVHNDGTFLSGLKPPRNQ